MTEKCYSDSQCFHSGTCCRQECVEWEREHSARCARYQTCVCDPVDATNYPNDATIYFAARFHNFYRPNIHVVFEDTWGKVTEDTYNIDSGYIWAYSSYDMNGWNGKITAELRDGSTVKETIVTYSGGPVGKVLNFKKVGGVTEAGQTVRIMCDMTNSGMVNGIFRMQLINSDTSEELGMGGGLCNPGGMSSVTFDVKLPSTPQKLNLRYNVITLIGETMRIDDYATMTIDVAESSAWARIDVDAPEYAHEDDEVVMNITVTNTGGVAAYMGVELYDGSTQIGACAGTSNIKPGEWIMSTYTRTMPNHDWDLTAKLVSDPPVDVTNDFTITLSKETGNGGESGDGGNVGGGGTGSGNNDTGSLVEGNMNTYIVIGVLLILLLRLLKK